MKLLKRTFLVQVQCCLWIALMAFATLGCSAKQTLVGAFDFTVEKSLAGSKALSNVVETNCTVLSSSEEVEQTVSIQRTALRAIFPFASSLGVNVFFAKNEDLREDYILELAGTDPPLYLMFQQIKLALL